MVRTAVLGLLISLLSMAASRAWTGSEHPPALSATSAGHDWNAAAFDPLWITLSRAEDPSITVDDLLAAAERPLRWAR